MVNTHCKHAAAALCEVGSSWDKLDGRSCSCRLNNPEAHTFCNNCNVLLAAAMDKAGLSEYCDASVEV